MPFFPDFKSGEMASSLRSEMAGLTIWPIFGGFDRPLLYELFGQNDTNFLVYDSLNFWFEKCAVRAKKLIFHHFLGARGKLHVVRPFYAFASGQILKSVNTGV